MTRLILTALFLAACLLPAPTAAQAGDLSKRDRQKLEKALRLYLREADPKVRDKLFKPIASLARKLDAEQVQALVASAVPGSERKRGYTHDVEVEIDGETFVYSVHVPEVRTKGLLPLVIDPGHASFKDGERKDLEGVMGTWLDVSGAKNDVIYVRTRVIDQLSRDGRYQAWTAPPRRPAGEPNMDTIARLLLAVIRDVALRYPVDPDRVVLHGISQTGWWAWWLGAYAPDRFAAVIPVPSVTWHARKVIPNLRSTSVFVLHGTADPTCPFAQAEAAVNDLKGLGAPVDFTAVEGGRHVQGVFPKWREVWPKVKKAVRDPAPKTFRRAFVSPTRPDAFWVRARGIREGEFNPWGPGASVDGRIEDQTLHLDATGVEGLTVFLSPAMLDLSKKVTIRVNDERVFVGKVKPDLRRAADVARERGDAPGVFEGKVHGYRPSHGRTDEHRTRNLELVQHTTEIRDMRVGARAKLRLSVPAKVVGDHPSSERFQMP